MSITESDNKARGLRILAMLRSGRARRPLSLSERGDVDATGHAEMSLSRMQPGEIGHILSLCSQCEARPHLLEMGFTPGTEIEFVRLAPLGDPLTVRVRGYQLSLRRREADAVWVRVCPPDFDFEALDALASPAAPGE